MCQTQTIPPFLIDHILPHLPLPDLLRCLRVSRLWHDSIVHLPAFREPLFQQGPRPSQATPQHLTPHPVLDKIALDWSIVLAEPVFSYSQASKPKLLNDVSVANAMATYPGVERLVVELVMERKPEPAPAAARTRTAAPGAAAATTPAAAVVEEEKRAVTTVRVPIERAEGVRVRDVWSAVVGAMGEPKHGFVRPAVRSAARGGRRERRPRQTLRETLMRGEFIGFSWALHAASEATATSSTTTTTTTTATELSATPPPRDEARDPEDDAASPAPAAPAPQMPVYSSPTLHGHTYTHAYSDSLAAELAARDADGRPSWCRWSGTRLAETRVVDVSF